MKIKTIFLKLKNLLKSKICNKSTASDKAFCNAFGTPALLALAKYEMQLAYQSEVLHPNSILHLTLSRNV